jgi:hypothetical protein
MPTAPVVPVNEYAGPSFEGFMFVLTNPGETNGKSWKLNIVTQVPFANYTALFTGTWDGSGMGMGPNKGPKEISDGQLLDQSKSATSEVSITFNYQNSNVGPVTGNLGTSYFAGNLSYTQGYIGGQYHHRVPPKWVLQGSVTTEDGDGNILDKGPGIVSGQVTV